ncbi:MULTISPECIES: copper resistance protein NlpE N-terminal domain-containing protein [unclassified Pseudoxanthomonas]|uniref:copper resistance protein NlpE N-terminal domain-containing protein n=1 Tax=unclassified Pseudoxanthomonas TaxID=2645906 RepID=UPI0008F1AFBA|nr:MULTISPECIES: copper resistance protein NlpE N-terminal domain-containing protein [unclassified Pseudoxanthomonas]PPJ43781.1 hypothetical protein C0063_11545 [Pseudoxanthomonas sp. KAs_5_3]SFV36254.1 NlpE N-terminal domain-containing protein [Pseudoxanthomonas sp. YR558]
MKWRFVPLTCALSLAASAANPTPPTFAGTFFGSLPAEACASQDVLLDLGADGRYVLEAHCQDDLQAAPKRAGRWSVTWNGTCVQLAPEDGQPAQEFAIHDDDLLVLTAGSCIEPIEDPRGRTLRRAEAAGEH